MKGLSREGIPLRSYRWVHLFFALPGALVFGIVLVLWRLTVRKEFPDTARVPKNAIICFFHGDLFIGFILMELFARFSRNGGWVLGLHHFVSYLWAAETYLRGWKVWRFHPADRGATRVKLIDLLKRPDVNTFRYATDSGGPYGVVRQSVVELSLASARPVVMLRMNATRFRVVKGHCLPLPFSTTRAFFSEAVSATELSTLGTEQARNHLQAIADELGKVAHPLR